MNSTLELAQEYVTWNPTRFIFPIKPGKKFPPLIADNLKKASNDPEQIAAWHAKWPGCNWGLALAMSNLICADVDMKPGKSGEKTYEALDLMYGWPATETTITPTGGRHYLYQGPHRFALGKYGFGEDIDSPNYILLPGCTLESGGEYTAIQSPPIADAPEWFYELFGQNKVETAVEQVSQVELDQPGNIEWAINYLKYDALPSIEGQQGEKTTFDTAGVLKDRGISEAKCLELMAEYYNIEWDVGRSGYCDPLWSLDESPPENSLVVKIRNAYSYLKQNAPGEGTAEAEFADEEVPSLEEIAKLNSWFENEFQIKKDQQALTAVDDTPPEDDDDPTDPTPSGSSQTERERVAAVAERVANLTVNNPTQADLCDRWVYVANSKLFVNRDNLDMMWDQQAFDNRFGYAKGSATKISKALFERSRATIRKPSFMVYEPTNNYIPDVTDVADPEKYNLYRPSDIVPAEGDTTLWNEHLAYLFPKEEDRNHVLNWCAWLIQNLALKPKHALIIAGRVQGTGKSFIAEVMTKILGKENVAPVGEGELSGQFNEWALKAKMILIEELRTAEKNHVAKVLHPLITQERIKVNDKNIKRVTIENCFGIFAMTNGDAAIPLDNSDRRYLVVRTEAEPRDQAYGESLYNGLLKDPAAIGAIAYELMNRDLSEYSGESRAPDTEAKAEMIIAGLTDLESWMVENAGSWPLNGRVICINDIIDVLPRRLERVARLIPNTTSILRERFRGVSLGQYRLKSGERVRLWAINRSAVNKIADIDIASFYEAEKVRAMTSGNKAADVAGEFAP